MSSPSSPQPKQEAEDLPVSLTGDDASSFAPRLTDLFHSLFSVLFPDCCRVCGEQLVRWTRVPVCAPCLGGLLPLGPSAGFCRICGTPRQAIAGELCGRCTAGEYNFDQARSFGAYEGALRELVHLLKYRRMRPLARPLGRRLAEAFDREWKREDYDAIVAVPLSPARLRDRGYNQAELLARELARHTAIPCLRGVCRRVRATAPQTGLTRAQRLENLRGAFAAGPRAAELDGKRVLLIDDVFTTGATLTVCSQALRRSGARRVCALTLARTLQR
jgi:ComF family protein